MVANIRGYTPNYGFKLINFDTPRWHTLEYANWAQLDSMFLQFGASGIRGEWLNSTEYLIGERVFDGTNGLIYRCLVQHVSAPTGSFADDRLANPTYWSIQLGGVPVYRGPWVAGTVYSIGDIVVVGEYEYFLCTSPHVAGGAFPGNGPLWQTIFDATEVVTDAQAAVDIANSSASSASTSASNAAQSETDAQAAAEAAADSAYLASSSQGAFRWNFDVNTAMADPGIADLQFNNTDWTLVTEIAISAQTADVGNPDVSGWVASWDDSTNANQRGTLYMREASSPENFVIFNIIGDLTDNGTWIHVPVAYVNHLGSYSTGDAISVSFSRTGNSGATGTGSGDMLSSENLNDVESKPQSRTNLGLGPTDTPAFTQITVANPPTQDDHVVTRGFLNQSPSLIISDTPPTGVQPGALWWESDAGMLYVYYDDGQDAPQWVQAVAIPSPNLSNYVQKSGDTMAGLLTLAGAPLNDLHAATKLYADGKTEEAIVDGRIYARVNKAWSEVPRYQRFDVSGVAQFDIQVPTWASAVRISGMITPTTTASTLLVLQVSLAAGVFLTANADYNTNGFQQQSDATTISNLHNQSTVPGLRVTATAANAAQPIIFDGLIKVKRHSSGRFTGDFRSAIAAATAYIHGFYHTHVDPASLGSALNVLALRLKPLAGSDPWAAESFVSVEWL